MSGMRLLWQETFTEPALATILLAPMPEKGLETALPGGWTAFLSPRSEAVLRAIGAWPEAIAPADRARMDERRCMWVVS